MYMYYNIFFVCLRRKYTFPESLAEVSQCIVTTTTEASRSNISIICTNTNNYEYWDIFLLYDPVFWLKYFVLITANHTLTKSCLRCVEEKKKKCDSYTSETNHL